MNDNLDEKELFAETEQQAAERIMREAAPFAAAAIVSLIGDDSCSGAVRFNAAKYVVDRNLGPIGPGEKQDALEAFLSELQNEANRGH